MSSATIPALERRALLVERQPITVRRRSARALARIVVLLAFDVLAFVAARALGSATFGGLAVANGPVSTWAGPLAPPGAPASLVFPITLLISLFLTGAYARQRPFTVGLRLLASMTLAAIVTAVTLAALFGVGDAVAYAAAFGALCLLLLSIGRAIAYAFTQHVWPRDLGALPAVRIGSGAPSGLNSARTIGDYVVIGELPIQSSAKPLDDDLLAQLHELAAAGIEAVVIAQELSDDALAALADAALDAGCRVIYPARSIPLPGIKPRLLWHRGEPLFETGTPVLRASAVLTKRVMDVIGSVFLLAVTAPLMAVIAIAIRLDSPGPVFFSHYRAGLGGRPFRMLKFRTMTADADERKSELAHLNHTGDVRLFKIPRDPRITRVGCVLRRWSLDELPQLINVLRGEMSLVGPRPFFESDFQAYEDRHFRRLDTKPGITGLWQVSGRSDVVDFDDVVFLDRQYIEQWSLWLDLSILLRTVPAVFRRTGAY